MKALTLEIRIKQSAALALMIFAVMMFACDDDNPVEGRPPYSPPDSVIRKSILPSECQPYLVSFIPMEILDSTSLSIQNIPNKYYELNYHNDSVINIVIRNNEGYTRYIKVTDETQRPQIDFNKKLLLATEVTTFQCGYIKNVYTNLGCGLLITTDIRSSTCGRTPIKLRQFVVIDIVRSVEFGQTYTNDLSRLLGKIITDTTCLSGIQANLDMQPLQYAHLKNVSDAQFHEFGTQMDPQLRVMFFLIENQNDYEQYVDVWPARPFLDFSKQTLVGCAAWVLNCGGFGKMDAELGCDGVVLRARWHGVDFDGCDIVSQFATIPKTSTPIKFRLK